MTGTVRSADGQPVEGVLVMGADLNYAETDPMGRFTLPRPEMALFFWCTGFRPVARVLSAGERKVDVVLRRTTSVRTPA
ncbi:MAG TPA: hypothetical protein VKR43_01475 [Bryobacteraceae bacterium]|nr:hypothetical protein [Bryobacteraceae bacterium]